MFSLALNKSFYIKKIGWCRNLKSRRDVVNNNIIFEFSALKEF